MSAQDKVEQMAERKLGQIRGRSKKQAVGRFVYISQPGGRPLHIGMNRAKRVARHADRRDRITVLAVLGTGIPKRDAHHSQLVRSRHRYYHEAHDEFVKRTAAQ